MTDVPADAPLGRRLAAYLNERFPPGAIVVLSVVTVLSAAVAAAAALSSKVALDPGLALLAVAYFLTLLLLRVMDEHKDFERDRAAYPQRVLSKGVVTLHDLRSLGWVAGAVALACSAALGPAPLVAHLVVLAFALLMAKEFFIGGVLHKDVFLYAVAHQPINPLITTWLLLGVAGRHPHALEPLKQVAPALGWYLLGQFALGFGYEVARKLWTPSEERPGLVDSYSSHAVGPRGAAAVALLLLLVGSAATSMFIHTTALPAWAHVFVALCALLCATTVGKFAASPFAGASKKLQGGVALGSLLLQVGLIAAAFAARGVGVGAGTWGWGGGA